MADPHHVETLDDFDRFTVGAYRAGLFVAAFGVATLAADLVWGTHAGRALVVLGVALIVTNLHLYTRTIRWAIVASGWAGVVLVTAAATTPLANGTFGAWVADAGLGFLFIVFSGVALKERYCFRLPIVVAIPALLAASLVPLRAGFSMAAAALLGAAALTLLVLAVAKLRMPLHFDIGDKRRYEV